MKKRNRLLAIILVSLICFMSVGSDVHAAGCSDYYLSQKGTARCTVNNCPGGFKRKERQDLYKQKCVRNNGSIYYNKKYKTVYVNCSCM